MRADQYPKLSFRELDGIYGDCSQSTALLQELRFDDVGLIKLAAAVLATALADHLRGCAEARAFLFNVERERDLSAWLGRAGLPLNREFIGLFRRRIRRMDPRKVLRALREIAGSQSREYPIRRDAGPGAEAGAESAGDAAHVWAGER